LRRKKAAREPALHGGRKFGRGGGEPLLLFQENAYEVSEVNGSFSAVGEERGVGPDHSPAEDRVASSSLRDTRRGLGKGFLVRGKIPVYLDRPWWQRSLKSCVFPESQNHELISSAGEETTA